MPDTEYRLAEGPDPVAASCNQIDHRQGISRHGVLATPCVVGFDELKPGHENSHSNHHPGDTRPVR